MSTAISVVCLRSQNHAMNTHHAESSLYLDEKAYIYVWSGLVTENETLAHMKFPDAWEGWVMSCIRSVIRAVYLRRAAVVRGPESRQMEPETPGVYPKGFMIRSRRCNSLMKPSYLPQRMTSVVLEGLHRGPCMDVFFEHSCMNIMHEHLAWTCLHGDPCSHVVSMNFP